VIAPLRARGYRRIWLAGISLGGFVAIGYAMRHPGEVEGLVTLAPYLGRRPLVQAVSEATSPAAWRQSAQPREADDFDHELWMWLTRRPADTPPLYMGYGTEDRFAQGHQTLASLLPAGHADTVAGGHDWAPWQQLWERWLDRGLLPRRCTA
jgi:pimeloyl-ACP methyl ester carboxylesterase